MNRISSLAKRIAVATIVFASTAFAAESFKPGDIVEYPVGGTWPQAYAQGTVMRELPGGKQVVVRRKNPYSPQDDVAYAISELRRPQPAQPAAPNTAATPPNPAATPPPALPLPPATAQAPAATAANDAPVPGVAGTPVPSGKGLLSKEQVIAYAREKMGANPWANANRDGVLSNIRDWVKSHGTNFVIDDDYKARMDKQGTRDSRIDWAVQQNYGEAPKLADYVGKWRMTAAVRGAKSRSVDGNTVTTTTTDAQVKAGELEIKADGTFVWRLSMKDPPEAYINGKWREAKTSELNAWEGGPALWLEKAQQNVDYLVRMNREPGWPGWIDVGQGPGRIAVQFGERQK